MSLQKEIQEDPFAEARRTAKVVNQIREVQANIDALGDRIDSLTKVVKELAKKEVK